MPTPDNSTPLATANTFLASIGTRDKASMRAVTHPDATACLIREGKPLHFALADVLKRISDQSDIEMDEVSYDEVEHVDGEFATVWTPYKFYEAGKVGFSLPLILYGKRAR